MMAEIVHAASLAGSSTTSWFHDDESRPRSTKKRRQFNSCDCCRHSRRACDAHTDPSKPCSECIKTGKNCSFDWLRTARKPSAKRRKQKAGVDVLEVPSINVLPDLLPAEYPRRTTSSQNAHRNSTPLTVCGPDNADLSWMLTTSGANATNGHGSDWYAFTQVTPTPGTNAYLGPWPGMPYTPTLEPHPSAPPVANVAPVYTQHATSHVQSWSESVQPWSDGFAARAPLDTSIHGPGTTASADSTALSANFDHRLSDVSRFGISHTYQHSTNQDDPARDLITNNAHLPGRRMSRDHMHAHRRRSQSTYTSGSAHAGTHSSHDLLIESNSPDIPKPPGTQRDDYNITLPQTPVSVSVHETRGTNLDDTYSGRGAGLRLTPNSETQLAMKSNRLLIGEAFVKIYRDSFEHMLSCWVTRSTCPYNFAVSRPSPRLQNPDEQPPIASRLRFHELVCNLQSTLGSLAKSFNPATDRETKATLQKVILAFASQWSLQDTRPRVRQPAHVSDRHSRGEFLMEDEADDLSTTIGSPLSFNRIMRQALWHEAHRSVQAMRDSSSFYAILANMIFALTQQPKKATNYTSPTTSASPGTYASAQSGADATPPLDSWTSETTPHQRHWKDKINAALKGANGSPMSLELALRQLQTWRRTLARLQSESNGDKKRPGPSPDEMENFNQFFWFGVMVDDTCAAISNTPRMIQDEGDVRPVASPDIAISVEMLGDFSEDGPVFSRLSRSSPIVALDIRQDTLTGSEKHCRTGDSQWPWLLEEAESTLREGTQLKVFMFRKVTVLQALVDRTVTKRDSETAIREALDVYKSFSAKFDPFIHQCLHFHKDIPAKFQSWYIMFATHWHLAVLLLADVIETLDRTNKGELSAQQFREESLLVERLRKSSAYTIARLSRASCTPRYHPIKQHRLDGDFTFCDEVLLTEPWSDILVRALSMAACVSLDHISDSFLVCERLDRSIDDVSTSAAYRNVKDCVLGLQQLSTKSDLADQLASEIQQELFRMGL